MEEFDASLLDKLFLTATCIIVTGYILFIR